MRYYFKTYPDDIPPERKSVLLRVVAVSLRLITREKNSGNPEESEQQGPILQNFTSLHQHYCMVDKTTTEHHAQQSF